jgi:hypothetical protein
MDDSMSNGLWGEGVSGEQLPATRAGGSLAKFLTKR